MPGNLLPGLQGRFRALNATVLRLDRSFALSTIPYLVAFSLVINPLVVRWLVPSEMIERLDLERFVLFLNGATLLAGVLLLSLRRRLNLTVKVVHLALFLPFAVLLFELTFRVILFSNTSIPLLESPGLYADADTSDDYWILYHYYSRAPFSTPEKRGHPLFGWLQGNGGSLGVVSDKYFKVSDVTRRPLLFFGDSFIAGAVGMREKIPQLLEEALPEFNVLNYGVGGYGTDQILLRLKHEAPRFRERDPLVLVGILLKDMDRSLLSFRISQKPYYTVSDGRLLLHLPGFERNADFVANYRFRTRSFTWAALRSLVRHALGSQGGDPARREEVNRLLTKDACEFVRTNGLNAYFVILYNRFELRAALDGEQTARERELKRAFASAGYEKVIDTKEPLLEGLNAGSLRVEDVFLPDGHYNATGNRLIVAILAKLISERPK